MQKVAINIKCDVEPIIIIIIIIIVGGCHCECLDRECLRRRGEGRHTVPSAPLAQCRDSLDARRIGLT